MKRIRIPKPVSGGLLLSYRCSARCRHCIYGCEPSWSGDWIQEEHLKEVLGALSTVIEADPLGSEHVGFNTGLHITGGEPFLHVDRLARAFELAKEHGIPSLFAETNAVFAVNDDITYEKLTRVKNAGMHGVMISVNPFTAEYVPFERTERAIRIAGNLFGENMLVFQARYIPFFRQIARSDTIPFKTFLARIGRETFASHISFFIAGRAPYALRDVMKDVLPPQPAEHFFAEECNPITSHHNHFDNYGNVIPGYCGGITLGNVRDIEEMVAKGIDSDTTPFLATLINGTMKSVYTLAEERGYRPLDEGYFSKCHLCIDVRRHLSHFDGFVDLKPKEFYEHLVGTHDGLRG